jgi:hypothetical protein
MSRWVVTAHLIVGKNYRCFSTSSYFLGGYWDVGD